MAFGRHWNIAAGDFLVLERQDGYCARYRVDRLWWPDHPGNQFFFYCSFNPRPME